MFTADECPCGNEYGSCPFPDCSHGSPADAQLPLFALANMENMTEEDLASWDAWIASQNDFSDRS